ncbi:hypothetical protein HQO44_20990 [Rhodococcus fascians]|nr:hypothetical protein [Rhodococcus fascians]
MATIGTAIESGSMQTVLLEPTSGEVLAHSTNSLDPDVTAVLPRAISDMRAEAAMLDVSVDAVAVVHRSESERAELATAVTDESTVFVSASQSFLSWLARTKDLADASTVLLYYMGGHGVSISLADAADATLTPAKNAALDSMSPERIGSTIPLAWEVVDESGKKPQAVALFGDRSSNRDLIDILSLGLGVPVVRVGAAGSGRRLRGGLARVGFGRGSGRSRGNGEGRRRGRSCSAGDGPFGGAHVSGGSNGQVEFSDRRPQTDLRCGAARRGGLGRCRRCSHAAE